MADGWIRVLVEAIHASPTQAVLYLSGGASQALGYLMSTPGASNTVLEAVVPYSRPSMIQLLSKVPTQFVSKDTAEEMALVAYNRALKLSTPGSSVVGVGFTASLRSSQPKRGDHRFCLSTRTCDRLWVSSVTLSKGLRSREEEDRVSSQFLVKAIADACKVSAPFVSELNESEAPDDSETLFSEDEELQDLINGKICMKVYSFSSEKHYSNPERKIILPGSFNPLHDGHLKLLDVATSICNGFPCFEISAINADKPPLTVSQIKERVKQFEKVVGWWSNYGNHTPNLQKIAMRILSLTTSSSGCERNWSVFEGLCMIPETASTDNVTSDIILFTSCIFDKGGGKTVIISNQPYFYKKAELFPGSAFVIGADTAARLINPKYYDGNYNKMLEILVGCLKMGTTFLVGGRNFDGGFKVLGDLEIPAELQDLFISIPEERFRMDISSTEIRKKLGL